jgi:hypothetical protein
LGNVEVQLAHSVVDGCRGGQILWFGFFLGRGRWSSAVTFTGGIRSVLRGFLFFCSSFFSTVVVTVRLGVVGDLIVQEVELCELHSWLRPIF